MTKSNFTYVWNPSATTPDGQFSYNLVGLPNCDTGILAVATTGTDFTLTNVTIPGFVALRNTDLINYVDIGYDDTGTLRPLIRLLPGEVAMFRLIQTETLRGQANTATVEVQYMIFQN